MRESLPAGIAPQLVIDDEFARLVPPMADHEHEQLEANLLTDGCLQPLTVWAETQVLLDGHNRYRLCRAHDIPFTVVEVNLDSRDDARRWIIDHQLGRRNVSPLVASYLRGRRYNLTKGPRGGHRRADGPAKAMPSAARSIAAEHRVDEKTIKRDGKFAAALDRLVELGGHRIKEALLSGKIKFTRAAVSRVASLPADAQRAAADQINRGVIRSLAEVLGGPRLPGNLDVPHVIPADSFPGTEDHDPRADASRLTALRRGCAGADQLHEAISTKTAVIGVVGLGYVGLPLARAFLETGYRLIGFDVDSSKVERLLAGESYIQHLPSEWIQDGIRRERFEPTDSLDRLDEPDVILICVPTPLSGSRDPDLSFVESTCRAIAASLRPGQLIILESTTYPGTTRDVMLPILRASGLTLGQDFFLAYSPEREDPGNPNHTARTIPKVVGGMESQSTALAEALYRQAVVDVVPVSSCEVAEAAKILENTYRAVNIALVNELKVLFQRMGIDVWEVIEAARSKPFGFQAFYPGPGLGGHCIPIDPFYLTWLARTHQLTTRFIELAGEINASMPRYVVDQVIRALNDQGKAVQGSRVCVLGMAYKKDVDDPRESPSFELIDLLRARGAIISYNDPHIPSLPRMRRHDVPELRSSPLTPEFLASQDCVLIATDHTTYDFEFIVGHAALVVDTRNATGQVQFGRDRIVKA